MSRSRQSAQIMAEISRATACGAPRATAFRRGRGVATIRADGRYTRLDSIDSALSRAGDSTDAAARAESAGADCPTDARPSSYVRAAADPLAASQTLTVKATIRFLGVAMMSSLLDDRSSRYLRS